MSGVIEPPALASADARARVRGKKAIVVGGGTKGDGIGNGRACALVLGREGAQVMVVDQDRAAGEETVAMIVSAGGDAMFVHGNVIEDDSCAGVAAACQASYGGLDVVVYAVGVVGGHPRVTDAPREDIDHVLATNVVGFMLMVKHAAPLMSRGGAIVSIGSVVSMRALGNAAYAASKGAVTSLTVELAGQLGDRGIRVNSVAPGAVWTPLAAHTVGGNLRRAREERAARTILGSEGTAWDIGYATLFLASDEARWITGQTLVVDGGQILR